MAAEWRDEFTPKTGGFHFSSMTKSTIVVTGVIAVLRALLTAAGEFI